MKPDHEKPLRYVMPPAGLGCLGFVLAGAVAMGAGKIPGLVRWLVNLFDPAN